jgi:hypothetical protein
MQGNFIATASQTLLSFVSPGDFLHFFQVVIYNLYVIEIYIKKEIAFPTISYTLFIYKDLHYLTKLLKNT